MIFHLEVNPSFTAAVYCSGENFQTLELIHAHYYTIKCALSPGKNSTLAAIGIHMETLHSIVLLA